jgi:hypothetical protein
MFTKNEELNQAIKEEMNVDEEDLKKAIKIIIDIEPKILCIDSMQQVNAKAIDREREEREKDTGNIKNNYIARFDDVKKTQDVIFKKIDDVYKLIIGLFIFLLTSYTGVTIFLILNKIYNWI